MRCQMLGYFATNAMNPFFAVFAQRFRDVAMLALCLAFDDADGVEGLELVEGDAEGVGSVV
jgi:hypothetical protein